jgi:hypothetical protein
MNRQAIFIDLEAGNLGFKKAIPTSLVYFFS